MFAACLESTLCRVTIGLCKLSVIIYTGMILIVLRTGCSIDVNRIMEILNEDLVHEIAQDVADHDDIGFESKSRLCKAGG